MKQRIESEQAPESLMDYLLNLTFLVFKPEKV